MPNKSTTFKRFTARDFMNVRKEFVDEKGFPKEGLTVLYETFRVYQISNWRVETSGRTKRPGRSKQNWIRMTENGTVFVNGLPANEADKKTLQDKLKARKAKAAADTKEVKRVVETPKVAEAKPVEVKTVGAK